MIGCPPENVPSKSNRSLVGKPSCLNRLSQQLLLVSGHKLALTSRQMQEASRKYAEREKHLLEMLEKKCMYLDPFLVLKRGYSVTYYNGKAVKDPLTVPDHGDLSTRLAEGVLKSKKI